MLAIHAVFLQAFKNDEKNEMCEKKRCRSFINIASGQKPFLNEFMPVNGYRYIIDTSVFKSLLYQLEFLPCR